jgi:hypothetical protein
MDDATKTLAEAAGLAATAARFPADVQEALATLAKHKAALPRSNDPRLEPIPAYQVPRA